MTNQSESVESKLETFTPLSVFNYKSLRKLDSGISTVSQVVNDSKLLICPERFTGSNPVPCAKNRKMKKYIYTNDIMRNIWTEHPIMNFPKTSHTYVSLEVLKEVLSKDEFRKLQLKIRSSKNI